MLKLGHKPKIISSEQLKVLYDKVKRGDMSLQEAVKEAGYKSEASWFTACRSMKSALHMSDDGEVLFDPELHSKASALWDGRKENAIIKAFYYRTKRSDHERI